MVKDPGVLHIHEAIVQIQAAEKSGNTVPHVNAMLRSMMTLRPNHALYRSHRQELTDPWVGPGAARHTT